MAINYGNYAQLYGQGVDLSPVQQAIQRFQEASKEKMATDVQMIVNDTWNNAMKPYQDAVFGDAKDIGSLNLSSLNASKAFSKFQMDLRKRGDKYYREATRLGLLNPSTFMQQYKTMKQSYIPQIEKKLSTYMEQNKFGKSEMKDFIEDQGLNEFLLMEFDDASPLKEYAKKDLSWREFFGRKIDKEGVVRPALGASGAVGLGRTASNRGLAGTGKALFSPSATGMENISSGKGMVGRQIKGSKYVQGLDKTLQKNQTKAEGLLKQSSDIRDKAFAKFKQGKKQQGLTDSQVLKNFEKSAAGKKHVNRVVKAGDLVTKRTDKATQGAWSVVSKKLKEKGADGLIKEIAKKAGPRTAAKLAARLGIGGLATISGFGTAAGIAMNAALIYDLYNILTSE